MVNTPVKLSATFPDATANLQRGAEEERLPPEYDPPDDLDPSNYIRGAKAAGEFMGDVHRTQIQHYVREGRLHNWPAAAVLGSHARWGDRVYYKPELAQLRQEVAAEMAAHGAAQKERARREAERAKIRAEYPNVEERDDLIFELAAQGMSGSEIARRVGLSKQRVSQILNEYADRPIGGGSDADPEFVTQAN